MKKLILLSLLSISALSSTAQYVTIPDANLVYYLHILYPSAMSGNQLDTTDISITTSTTLDLSNRSRSLQNLYGIQFFDSLKRLECSLNDIDTLPRLPSTLEFLNCNFNDLVHLPTLPNSLKQLYCRNNKLLSMPGLPQDLVTLYCNRNSFDSLGPLPGSLELLDCSQTLLKKIPQLPNSLKTLNCFRCPLTNLPPLPESLQELTCSKTSILSLPKLSKNLLKLICSETSIDSLPLLPDSLKYLVCSSNSLTSLPALPSSLETLDCDNNNLVNLPDLPSSLKSLTCSQNNIIKLPALSNSLGHLDCASNLIKNLPVLEHPLRWLDCTGNQLTKLPTLPESLVSLYCGFNNLYELPPFPSSLTYIRCDYNINLSCLPFFTQKTFNKFIVKTGTNIHCLPRKVERVLSGGDGSNLLPLCSPTSGCPLAYNITGNVHQDTSINCISDSLSNGIMLSGIKMLKFTNGHLEGQTYTNFNGIYSFSASQGDTIDILVDTTYSFDISCPFSGKRTAIIESVDSVFTTQHFGIKCPGVDLGVLSIQGTFRPTRSRPIFIQAGDKVRQFELNCVNGISGSVTTTILGSASYLAPLSGALTPSSITRNKLTYSIADFGTIDPKTAFNIIVQTDSNATIGSDICIETILSTSANDINSANDTLLFCGAVVNSYDPNDKAAYPSNVTTPHSWITYTIRYQNTGTDTAYDIFIRDTLSTHLDESTFTYLDGSVRPQINLSGKAILFNLPNINLLDSFSNEPESNGWLQYKVKTKADLDFDDVIENTAYIYFDQNSPVVTNTTSNLYAEPTAGIKVNRINESFKVYPNPTKGNITITFDQSHSLIQARVLTITGQEITTHNASDTNTFQFDFEAAKGIYLIEIITENGRKSMVRVVRGTPY